MSCKRKIFGENLTRNKEDTCYRRDGSRMKESGSEIHETRNCFHGNGRENGTQSRTDILQSSEHKRKFAKLKTYFTTLSVKISPSKIGSSIKNSRFLTSKSCDNLLCKGSTSSCHGNTQSKADGTAASSYKITRPSWLIRSKPIGLKFGKFKVRYEVYMTLISAYLISNSLLTFITIHNDKGCSSHPPERCLETIQATGSHSQPMDIFPFYGNPIRQRFKSRC